MLRVHLAWLGTTIVYIEDNRILVRLFVLLMMIIIIIIFLMGNFAYSNLIFPTVHLKYPYLIEVIFMFVS